MSVRQGVPFNRDHHKDQQMLLDMTAMFVRTCSKLTHHNTIKRKYLRSDQMIRKVGMYRQLMGHTGDEDHK